MLPIIKKAIIVQQIDWLESFPIVSAGMMEALTGRNWWSLIREIRYKIKYLRLIAVFCMEVSMSGEKKIIMNYEVVELLHRSSIWGNLVFKVKPIGKDQLYVLKCFSKIESGLQKLIFNREMEALKTLNSCEGIVKIWDTNTELYPLGKEVYGGILMDYVPGETLDHINWEHFTQLKKYEICLKILKAVNSAHSNNVIHRDIKPSNVIYDVYKDKVILIDFGASKIKTVFDSETTMPMYSEGYSAPELIDGKIITEKCDYYSLGIVMSEILLSQKISNCDIHQAIEKWSGRREVKEILLKLIQKDPDSRPDSLIDVIDVFENLIGTLNTSSYSYNIAIDYKKLEELKRSSVVEEKMTMVQLTNSFLKREFQEAYGFYNTKYDKYVITGARLVIECVFDKIKQMFFVTYISTITADRRNKNIKRSFKIIGKLMFVQTRSYGNYDSVDNSKLVVMFENHQNDNQQYQLQEERFDNLFGGWEKGLTESVETEKGKSAIIQYSNYEVEGNQLIMEITDCLNKSIDEIIPLTKFVVESNGDKGVIYTDVGTFEEIICQDDSVKMVFSLPRGRLKPNVRALLNKKIVLREDFHAKTTAYRRQFKAIYALKMDEYSARSLKDIILCLDEPEEILTISEPEFISRELNESQKQAVIKALNTESICLIQGPPGTGKTSVIKEIIGQIIKRDVKMTDSPKILIVSQSHTAVDNILEGLSRIVEEQTAIIRIGADRNISKAISEKYTINAHRGNLIKEIENNVHEYIEQKQILIGTIDNKEEKEKWNNIKLIQEDWLKRLVDQESLDYQMIRSAVVIAGTCVGFLSNEIIKDMSFDYVIIDEAAKATTPELLVSIIKAKKIILVGDQNQLPAYADINVSPILAELTRNPDYRLFDILYNSLPKTHKQILTTQYRMIENIGNLISQVFYNGIIDTGCDDEKRRHGLSRYCKKSIVWFDTSQNKKKMQKRTKGGSYINEEEKRIILEILNDLKNSQELEGLDIGIITGYSGQKELLRKSIKASGFDKIATIDVNTLDAFQGRENDIIMYSTVRTRDSIGFQKEKERINVAFSRAKKLLMVCGDMEFFYNFDDPDNKFVEIIDYITENDQCDIIRCDGGKMF